MTGTIPKVEVVVSTGAKGVEGVAVTGTGAGLGSEGAGLGTSIKGMGLGTGGVGSTGLAKAPRCKACRR